MKSTDFGASGIQLGDENTSGSIKIVGFGELKVTGGDQGCGIGTIFGSCAGWRINIEDCTVTAQAKGNDPAGIGSRASAWCGDITIKNAMITSTGAANGAGIGCGDGGRCGNITIENAEITSTGAQFGAGIGSGQRGVCGNITITLKQGDTKENFLGRMKGYRKVGAGRFGNCGTVIWR